jgi:hypothetical protein
VEAFELPFLPSFSNVLLQFRYFHKLTVALFLKKIFLGVLVILISAHLADAQPATIAQKVLNLSNAKWQWMSAQNIDKLNPLFHGKTKFVHLSGTWKGTRNLKLSRLKVYGTRKLTFMRLL